MTSRSDVAREIFERAHITGEFKLRSGQTSNEYFDKYRFEAHPALLREIAELLAELLPADVDALAGLELGGVPIATVLSQVSGKPTLFVRKEAKEYGTMRLAEGGDVDGQRLVVVEDVITTGGQVIESCAALRDRGAIVETVLCVVQRDDNATELLAAQGLELRALFQAAALTGAETR